MVIAFTGHRPNKLGGYAPEAQALARARVRSAFLPHLQELKAAGWTAVSGMALGVDQWAAELCAELGIQFGAAVPFRGQEAQWPLDAQRHYAHLLRCAAWVHVVDENVNRSSRRSIIVAMQKRNEWMVDNSDLLLAYWNNTPGGTRNCVNYAMAMEKPIINAWEGCMSLYVKRIISTLQGGVDQELGPKTVIIGKNGTGKTRIPRSIELAVRGTATDVAGRAEVAKGIELLGLASPGKDLLSTAILSDGSQAKFELKRITKGKGAKKTTSSSEGEVVRPASVDVERVLPMHMLRAAILGAPGAARKFFLTHSVKDITRTDVLALLPTSLHEPYAKALHASGVLAHVPEIDKLLAGLEYATKRARESNSEAKGAAAVTSDSGQGLPPPPTEIEYNGAQGAVVSAKAVVERAVAGYQQQTQRAELEQRAAGIREKLAQAQGRLVQAQQHLAYIEGEGAKLPSLDAARAAVKPMDPGQLAVIQAVIWHAVEERRDGRLPQLGCSCCGLVPPPGTFAQRAVMANNAFQNHAASQEKAQKELDWVEGAYQKLSEYLTKARFEVTQAQGAIEGRTQELGQVEAMLTGAATDTVVVTIEDARAALMQAEAKLKVMDDGKAAWAATRKSRDAATNAETEASRWEQLSEACGNVVRDLLDAGVNGFISRVQVFLPPTDRFGLRVRDGAREVCQFGLYKGDDLHTALSGAEWARVMAAMAAVCGPASDDKLAVVVLEDRAFDPETLTDVLVALGKVPQQVIFCTPVAPSRIPDGWTVVTTGPMLSLVPPVQQPFAAPPPLVRQEVPQALPLGVPRDPLMK